MADVTLRHVYKVYDGGVRAVNNFDLEIKDKEFVVFVGPSGCGKSTTLRMIAGLEDITAGQLFIDGELMNEVEPKNRDIAMVFQSYALYPHMTVYQNMAFGLKLRHVPKEEIDKRVKAAAEILEISELLSRKPKALSGGQRQRVALGRTIVRDPKVFLLDEPLSNLDAKLRVSMRSEITKLHERLQTTFIYVTHDQTEAMTMGNRIVVMKDGFIQQADTPIALFEDPSNLFVATFLGSPQMNIIEAELFLDGETLKAKLAGNDDMIVTFPDVKAKQLKAKYYNQKVLLGIRPEHIRPNEGDIKVFIEVVEHLGDESIVYTKMNNRKEPIIIKIPFNSKIKSNVETNISLNMDHVYMFDYDTHRAIIGIPFEDEIPVRISGDSLKVGEQAILLDNDYHSRLVDSAFDNDVLLGIKPDYIAMDAVPNSIKLRATLEFIEQKTNYQAVYFSLKGVEGYFAIKVRNDVEVELGKEIDIFLPYQKVSIYDLNHNRVNSREIIYPNTTNAIVEQENGEKEIIIRFGGTSLRYPNDSNYPAGEYELTLLQDKLIPLFPHSMLKNGYSNPEVEDAYNKIKVSAYDEDILGSNLLTYVEVKGFDKYCSFIVNNNFSVYKLPKFDLYVPRDALILKPKK